MKNVPLILALDVGGSPLRWVNYEAAAYYYAKDMVAWSIGSDDYTIFGGNNRISGDRSSLTMNTIIAIKGPMAAKVEHKRNISVPLTNKSLFHRDRHICAYCSNTFSFNDLTRDHVKPRALKGEDVWTNVVTACGSCNSRKGSKTVEQSGMKLLYVPYAPNRNEFLILSNRNILADQMNFLMKGVPKNSRLLT